MTFQIILTTPIPTNLRGSYIGDTLTRDGFHLSLDHGRYSASMTWFAALTGLPVEGVTWVPKAHPHLVQDLPAIREAVANAVASPMETTASSFQTNA